MKADRPSRTAHLVAFGRAVADAGVTHVKGFRDPTAREFLTEKGERSLAKLEQLARQPNRGARFEMTRSMGDLMALRTSAIDAAVRDAVAGGARQLVILGAGYDGRAWRMPELAGVSVFEVDHPATQREKRARVSKLPAAIGTVAFVPIDFERESLANVLAMAGHNPAVPTCWIWEGVVMYLTRDAMRATLGAVAKWSAPGSTLIVNYHTIVRRRLLAQIILMAIGEPQKSAWTPEQMAADLDAAGFRVVDDTGMQDWNARFAGGRARVDRSAYMRIAVARTRA
ncbi:MAG TPA: SAM-dependent methyltransferase [Gemmatimonadaceae bacterium]|nr:SAM-dependent methyltransferase [Gemmatimonadaceae bacterium]